MPEHHGNGPLAQPHCGVPLNISIIATGTICHDTPYLSVSHPHCTSLPPSQSPCHKSDPPRPGDDALDALPTNLLMRLRISLASVAGCAPRRIDRGGSAFPPDAGGARTATRVSTAIPSNFEPLADESRRATPVVAASKVSHRHTGSPLNATSGRGRPIRWMAGAAAAGTRSAPPQFAGTRPITYTLTSTADGVRLQRAWPS